VEHAQKASRAAQAAPTNAAQANARPPLAPKQALNAAAFPMAVGIFWTAALVLRAIHATKM
tara:strand:+ start:73 stop:255 length:183 start_codon:yes stop_codon:yes gene_type:complete